MEYIHKYRKFRRNNKNKDFADSMRIDFKNFKKCKDEYLFMNTADILLLNISKFFDNKKSDDIDCVIKTINTIKDFCLKNNSFDNQSVSSFTKSHASFQAIRDSI